MAEKWYPVIDYTLCIECGTCVEKCPHGVYDVSKTPAPVVVNPLSCVDHCHGCGNRCPVGAITYIGDDTGWTPPKGTPVMSEAPAEGKVRVEYLYLDLKTCDRCIGTDRVLDDVMAVLTPALRLAGYEVEYRKTEMKTEDLAKEYQFLSSPTIRVNGRDICSSVRESSCGCCSEISSSDVDCRVFEYRGKAYEVPPKEMLAEGILQAVFGSEKDACSCGSYRLPDNLKAFFEGKNSKSSCSCGGNEDMHSCCGREDREPSCSCGGSCC